MPRVDATASLLGAVSPRNTAARRSGGASCGLAVAWPHHDRHVDENTPDWRSYLRRPIERTLMRTRPSSISRCGARGRLAREAQLVPTPMPSALSVTGTGVALAEHAARIQHVD
jgi:hypothetical protein